MSLHIILLKPERKFILDLAMKLVKELNLDIIEMGLNSKYSDFDEDKIKSLIEKSDEYKVQIFIKKDDYKGYLQINDFYDAKIFGDIEVDFFDVDFIKLINDKVINKGELDNFCVLNKKSINRAFVDLNGEGDDNPLDVLYEYDSSGRSLFLKVMRVLENFSEEDDEYEDLYEKLSSSDKNVLSSRLWQDSNFKSFALKLAQENNVIAQEGSFKLYAKNSEELKNYYKSMIDKILKPLFIDVVSLEDRMFKVAKKLK